jgi:hypothetical protein
MICIRVLILLGWLNKEGKGERNVQYTQGGEKLTQMTTYTTKSSFLVYLTTLSQLHSLHSIEWADDEQSLLLDQKESSE